MPRGGTFFRAPTYRAYCTAGPVPHSAFSDNSAVPRAGCFPTADSFLPTAILMKMPYSDPPFAAISIQTSVSVNILLANFTEMNQVKM